MSHDRPKLRQVVFYRTAGGKKPVGEWLNDLDDERAQSVAMGIRFFEEYPLPVVPAKFFEKVSEHIWEIKCHHGKEQFRVLAFLDGEAVVIAVVGLEKKSQKLSKQMIKLADDRRKDHLARKPKS
jgi:hypothetical protein